MQPFWKAALPLDKWNKFKTDPNPNIANIYRMYFDEGIYSIGKTNQAGRNMFLYTVIAIQQNFRFIDSKNERLKTLKEIHTEPR